MARHTGEARPSAPQQALEVIRARSKVCRDQTIAATLNRLGYRTGTGKPGGRTVSRCAVSVSPPQFPKEHDWLTLEQAAAQLGVSATVIRRLIAQGTLPASQECRQPLDYRCKRPGTPGGADRGNRAGKPPPPRPPRPPALPGQGSPQAGAEHASLSSAAPCNPQLRPGEQ